MDDLAPAPNTAVEHGETGEPRVPHRLFALKDKDTFVVSDAFGDILGAGDGLFRDDTRILSRFRLLLGGHSPSLLSSALAQDNVFFTSNCTNSALPFPGASMGPPGVLHVERKRFLWEERLYERIAIVNYSRDPVIMPLTIEFDADFHDMFEVRGMKRTRRGTLAPPEIDGRQVRLAYEGLDGVRRTSVIAFSDAPGRLSARRAEFMVSIHPEGRHQLYLEIGAEGELTPTRERFRGAAARARWEMRARNRLGARVHSSGRLFNEWLNKSRADIALLTTPMETGPYPYAGIPWFSTAFGRDAIITAWQILWIDPSLARGVLAYLAAHQAHEISAFRDSAPGKIMHETRKGEMPALGEVPFGRYYGGVDTTPLFVALAGAYAERTGDMALIDQIWPALKRAADWMEVFGDTDGDGLIDYKRGSDSGLANQGWKDSEDSVFHVNGRFPDGPIALVEVQGYAFAAYRALARFARLRGAEGAEDWEARAERLRRTVEDRFWMEAQGFYGMAIDGDGVLCEVLGSNPGHLLFSGLPAPDRARRVVKRLSSNAFASGWGVRTLAVGEARFNPMSYHNGSVWPHDTAVCAMGMSRYGEREDVVRLTAAMFETAAHFEMRLPELFCGFPRFPGEPPVAYPVACLPQAWAAGSVFMMLQACLGLQVDALERRIEIVDPHLPVGISRLNIEGLAVGDVRVDLLFELVGEAVLVRVTGANGVEVAIK
ncbi:MAG: amylo-alpha-1,6-glucosidase [Phenylobacterium sp.]|uniref:amylo-alpha-1,6-glucosidase n=1 Tax=Phenylobacterium sp. TaxID=1871053 RepID=UPI002733FEAB|nr:amylo-alpha-1,6-glucosidase [Phenylobacterium sp.]MDP3176089.1 amylo-alpha-1,6-glucosidase [Phenylobacterium sp.]